VHGKVDGSRSSSMNAACMRAVPLTFFTSCLLCYLYGTIATIVYGISFRGNDIHWNRFCQPSCSWVAEARLALNGVQLQAGDLHGLELENVGCIDQDSLLNLNAIMIMGRLRHDRINVILV